MSRHSYRRIGGSSSNSASVKRVVAACSASLRLALALASLVVLSTVAPLPGAIAKSRDSAKMRALPIAEQKDSIGNLVNPISDARAVENGLRKRGFDRYTVRTNLNLREMRSPLDEFQTQLRIGDLALLCYTGHGVGVSDGEREPRGQSSLPPVDFDHYTSESGLVAKALSETELRDRRHASQASAKVVLLDACRNGSYAGDKSLPGGPAVRESTAASTGLPERASGSGGRIHRSGFPSSCLVMRAAQEGNVASDAGLLATRLASQPPDRNRRTAGLRELLEHARRLAGSESSNRTDINFQDPEIAGDLTGTILLERR